MAGDPTQLTHNMQIVAEIIQTISVCIGVVILAGAIFQLKKYGESRTMMSSQHTLAGPIMMIFASAALLSLPVFIDMTLITFVGSNSPLGYSGYASDQMNAVIMFVRVVGVGSFVRGLVLLSRTGGQQSQPGTVGKALIHLFGGLLCVHIIGTYQLFINLLNI